MDKKGYLSLAGNFHKADASTYLAVGMAANGVWLAVVSGPFDLFFVAVSACFEPANWVFLARNLFGWAQIK